MAEINFNVAFIGNVIKLIWNIIPTLMNLLRRPKACIEFKNQNIRFKNSKDIESHITYPCILIAFTKDVKIDARSININNESLHCMLSNDPNHLRQNPESKESHTVINNRIMPFVYDKWGELTQRACWFEIKSKEQEVFPLYINTVMSHGIFNPKKNSRVFAPKTKLILSLNIDGSDYEYGISLINACKVIINNLAPP
jgi:hypothetical protein